MKFEPIDRNMLWEMGYWADTLERWYGEGLCQTNRVLDNARPGEGIRGEALPHDEFSTTRMRDQDVHETLGFDRGTVCLPLNSGPQPLFENVVFEETDHYVVYQDELGVRKMINKTRASVPNFIGWPVSNRKDFDKLKDERFQPGFKDRIPENWAELVELYKTRDYPLAIGGYPYGFYGFLRFLMGEERLLVNFYDNPDLISDMMSFLADFWIALWDRALSEIKVDCAHFWEDMAYHSGPFISPSMFKQFIMPSYKRITGFLKERGVEIILVDCDGNLDELIPLFLDSGVTGVYPIEVQAGNDIVSIRKKYPKLQITGGLDKSKIAKGRDAIDEELESKLPIMLDSGGYIPHLDHSAPPDISWENFCYYRDRVKQMISG